MGFGGWGGGRGVVGRAKNTQPPAPAVVVVSFGVVPESSEGGGAAEINPEIRVRSG